jgi:hypothetical protein
MAVHYGAVPTADTIALYTICHGFVTSLVHVGFVMNEAALGGKFWVLRFFLKN